MMMGQRRAASARARTPGLDGVARVSPPSFAIQASGSNDSSLQESLSTKGSRVRSHCFTLLFPLFIIYN